MVEGMPAIVKYCCRQGPSTLTVLDAAVVESNDGTRLGNAVPVLRRRRQQQHRPSDDGVPAEAGVLGEDGVPAVGARVHAVPAPVPVSAWIRVIASSS